MIECSNAGLRRPPRAAVAAIFMLVALLGPAIAGENTYVNGIQALQRHEYATAARIIRSLADKGDSNAQWRLGMMYYHGEGVPRNEAEAVKWFRKAADQGFLEAWTSLGSAYFLGDGVQQNCPEAMKWFLKAANFGDAYALGELGSMYEKGCFGVPQNYILAYKWFTLAATRDLDPDFAEVAKNDRDRIAQHMAPSQIAEARGLAQEWCASSEIRYTCDVAVRVARRENKSPLTEPSYSRTGVPLKLDGGVFVVPVEINGIMTLDFAIDSGAADVTVPADVFSTLKRGGTIKDSDVIGQRTYVLADGSRSQSSTFTIRSLKVGTIVVENVRASVVSSQGSLLLGQTFLERFRSWSIDNAKYELLLERR